MSCLLKTLHFVGNIKRKVSKLKAKLKLLLHVYYDVFGKLSNTVAVAEMFTNQ